jgi:primase-polymerase (primpol)-like protein
MAVPTRQIWYDRKRYFVVTGRQVTGTPDEIMPAHAAIDAIHGQVFGNQPVETVDTTAHANTPEKGEGGRGRSRNCRVGTVDP